MAESMKIKVGVIGGSGLYDPDLLTERSTREVTTPFGAPSDAVIEGKVGGVPCAFLARHGKSHQHQPSDVNYRANIWALKSVGCTHILASTATGSLQEQYRPGDLVVLSDFIDRTWGRSGTFHDGTPGAPAGVCHLPMSPAFCARARSAVWRAANACGYSAHEHGTVVVVQGPRFSSRAESLMHRQWGAHLVNMTTAPEVVLAKELGMSYAALALVTDYDCWRESDTSVSVEEVLGTIKKNVEKAKNVIMAAIAILASEDLGYLDELKTLAASSVMLKK